MGQGYVRVGDLSEGQERFMLGISEGQGCCLQWKTVQVPTDKNKILCVPTYFERN